MSVKSLLPFSLSGREGKTGLNAQIECLFRLSWGETRAKGWCEPNTRSLISAWFSLVDRLVLPSVPIHNCCTLLSDTILWNQILIFCILCVVVYNIAGILQNTKCATCQQAFVLFSSAVLTGYTRTWCHILLLLVHVYIQRKVKIKNVPLFAVPDPLGLFNYMSC